MRQPWWKIALSYLTEIHIESESTDFNPHLYVSLKRGRYQLSTANAIYSFGDLYTNFSRTFDRINWKKHPTKDVLLLGLGLGSIPYILEKEHALNSHYTAVEIDEAVVDFAYRYVLNELDCPLEMITSDAALVVPQLPAQSYDLICVDIFDDDTVPPVFEEIAFLENVRELLRPAGILLFNRLAATSEDELISNNFYNRRFTKVFPKAHKLDVGGNFMLVSDRDCLKKL